MWTVKLSKQAESFYKSLTVEYESLLETLDILETEPDILKKLKKTEKEMAAGHYKIWRKD